MVACAFDALPIGPGAGRAPTALPPPPRTVAPPRFPFLDAPLEGRIAYSNGDGNIYVIEPRPNVKPNMVVTAPSNQVSLIEPSWSPD
jgi:hypothetical protein